MICRDYLKFIPDPGAIAGATICEVGAGDCLATAALFLGLGAKSVDLVELNPAVVNEKQIRSLAMLREQGVDLDCSIISNNGATPSLDTKRVRYHSQFMEEYVAEEQHDWIFSYDVFEHVEDLPASFDACFHALKPGGRMVNIIDLGGHGEFEDPLPPLDFQTYSDWLYECMYPKFHRATRRFVSEYVDKLTAAGFLDVSVTPLRTVDSEYLDRISPRLRTAARARPREELRIIEFALTATRGS